MLRAQFWMAAYGVIQKGPSNSDAAAYSRREGGFYLGV